MATEPSLDIGKVPDFSIGIPARKRPGAVKRMTNPM
jgi:hypothetical protein